MAGNEATPAPLAAEASGIKTRASHSCEKKNLGRFVPECWRSNVTEEWVKVCAQDDLLPGEFKVVWDGDTAIAVYNLEGDLYAIEDVCTHDGGELAGGDVCGFEVECPRHGAKFDVRTGEATLAPATEPVASFPIRVEGGVIYTRDDRS